MAGIQPIYAEAVHAQFSRYFANFLPNTPIKGTGTAITWS